MTTRLRNRSVLRETGSNNIAHPFRRIIGHDTDQRHALGVPGVSHWRGETTIVDPSLHFNRHFLTISRPPVFDQHAVAEAAPDGLHGRDRLPANDRNEPHTGKGALIPVLPAGISRQPESPRVATPDTRPYCAQSAQRGVEVTAAIGGQRTPRHCGSRTLILRRPGRYRSRDRGRG